MTAPAIAPTAPAPAAPSIPSAPVETAPVTPAVETPAAPTQPTVQNESGMDALINRISRKVTPQALVEIPLGTDANAAPAPVAAAPTDTTPPVTEATQTIAPVMSSEVAIDTPNGKVTLRARDPNSGQFVQIDTSVKFDLAIPTEDGASKVYESKTLPDVLRLAQDGLNMQKARAELKYYRENIPTWQKTSAESEQAVAKATEDGKGWEALAISLLTESPDWVNERRTAYNAQFTPENELARAKARIAQLEASPQTTIQRPAAQPPAQQSTPGVDQALVQGFAQRVSSAVAEVEGLVGKEAAAGHIALMTAPLLVKGQLPPERFQTVENYVNGPFREWAKAESAKRTSATTATEQALKNAQETERRAQLAARSVGTATRPNAVTTGTQAPVAKKPTNVRDMVDHIARRPSPAQTGSLLAG